MTQFYHKQIYLLQLFMRGCIWYGLFILLGYLECMKSGEFHPFLTMLLFPVMLLFWILANYIRNQKFKLAALIVVSILFLGFTDLPWYFLVIETALQISNKYFKEEKVQRFGVFWETWIYNLPGIFLMLLFLILFSIWSAEGNPNVSYSAEYAGGFLLGAWILFLIGYMLNNYMKNFYQHFSYRTGPVKREAFHRAKRSNYAMMIILGVLGIGAMFLFMLVPMGLYEKILSAIKQLLYFAFGSAVSNLPQIGAQNTNPTYLGIPGAAIEIGGKEMGFNGNLFSAALILLLVFLVIMLLMKIYKSFLVRYQIETDTAEFVSPKEDEENIYREKGYGFFAVRFGNSNRDKIRKIYYQTILKRFSRQPKERKKKVSNTQTPYALSGLLSSTPKEKQTLDAMTAYYEKARFGKEECTDEEVEKVRGLQ